MSDYILLPNGNFVSEDELYHWKYIKRERKGDKWVYTYDKPKDDKAQTKKEENKANTTTAKSSVKNWINNAKDKLGVDEREKYKKTKYKYDVAKEELAIAQKAVKNFNSRHAHTTYKAYPHDEHREVYRESAYRKEVAETLGRDYISARSAYMNTPLGVFLKASDFVGDVAFNVGYTVDKTVDKAKDIAFEVEYALGTSTGIDQKRKYDNAAKNLEKAKTNLVKAKYNDRYMAEFFLEKAEKKYQEAKNAYVGTPMYHLESGVRWITDRFNDR